MLRPRTIQEGSVGLFALLGLVLLVAGVFWLRGTEWGQQSYEIFVDFEDASGLQLGAPVRFRGVTVGKLAGLVPSSNGIRSILEINSSQLRMPKDSKIVISRYGLIGEAAIDISPPRKLSPQALKIDPLSQNCRQSQQIICNQAQLQGKTGSQLIDSLTRLSDAYSNPQLMQNINETLRNAALASARVANMSNEIALLSKSARLEVRGISRTSKAIAEAAENASVLGQNLNQVVVNNQKNFSQTVAQAALLTGQLNELIASNRSQLTATLAGIDQTNRQIQNVGKGLETSVTLVNEKLTAVDAQLLSQQVNQILTNIATTSENLRQISTNLNDPQLLLIVQKTLDSARSTLENAQKITTDVEQLTGDPSFRSNLRKLVEGLGNLVSTGETLQQQVYAQRLLRQSDIQLKYQLDLQRYLLSLETPH